ncbi:MAG: hypothetical protein UT08_C0007G0011 [Candidatus Woesebacteria bacterium GW2011_GWB1_38_8]|uniref:Uncharacterized protein n=1 Tax=Candidatus Woesebacteria bacterium GW2011_GWB1_38_8 TaxID=1618570 RepID=A0A0G0L069_9BACT|nr:MAG: hypothetical protein UT08_C0007G0011 [Candidatus Woesebacteria bacterium GW2011_GWB1_38_8]
MTYIYLSLPDIGRGATTNGGCYQKTRGIRRQAYRQIQEKGPGFGDPSGGA